MPPPVRHRLTLYFLANIVFALLVGIGYAVGGYANPRLLHLIVLFALCATVIIDLDGLNGRYALLALFMLVYFISYGLTDLINLFTGSELPSAFGHADSGGLMSKTEAVILLGGIMLVLGYRLAVTALDASPPRQGPKDWSNGAIFVVGSTMWFIGTVAMYRWNVYIVADTTNEAVRRGLSSMSPLETTLYLLGQMCQPLGILLLAYALSVFRRPYLLAIIVVVVAVQLFIGFVADVKGLAMLGIILVVLTSVLVDGRFPKLWLGVFALFVLFLFPYFQAYRGAIHGNVARTTVVENFGKILQRTIAAKDKVNSGRERAQTFFERASLKGSTEMIVEKTGNGVEFQRGHTLSPMLAVFIPKILWSDKFSVPTGQLVNKQFHVTDSDDIWVSPSHLGGLYWNFGWPGVIVGMTCIGMICGWVGSRFNLADSRTITRVLVTVITIKQLIVGFEGVISDIYVVWMRSLAGIGILHLIFARVPAPPRLLRPAQTEAAAARAIPPNGRKPFPNLSA